MHSQGNTSPPPTSAPPSRADRAGRRHPVFAPSAVQEPGEVHRPSFNVPLGPCSHRPLEPALEPVELIPGQMSAAAIRCAIILISYKVEDEPHFPDARPPSMLVACPGCSQVPLLSLCGLLFPLKASFGWYTAFQSSHVGCAGVRCACVPISAPGRCMTESTHSWPFLRKLTKIQPRLAEKTEDIYRKLTKNQPRGETSDIPARVCPGGVAAPGRIEHPLGDGALTQPPTHGVALSSGQADMNTRVVGPQGRTGALEHYQDVRVLAF